MSPGLSGSFDEVLVGQKFPWPWTEVLVFILVNQVTCFAER